MEHFTGTMLPVVFTEHEVDDALDQSFPASDPPPWTTGGAETRPAAPAGTPHPAAQRAEAGATALRWARYTLEAALISLMVPVVIVLLPLALVYGVLLAAADWPAPRREARARRRAATRHVLTGV